MTIASRDRAIVQLVARFRQASSTQIFDALFYNLTSRTPCDRALRRLVDEGYLSRIERRTVGGARGGSGVYVYQLGRKGFYTYFDGKFQPWRAVNYHALAILDAFVVFRQLERQGGLSLIAVSTEPDAHEIVGGIQLKPDLFIELANSRGEKHKLWLEIDQGTEGQKRIMGKLETYWRAYNQADVAQHPIFPRVLFVACDEERYKELRWLIDRAPEASQQLFQVTTGDKLVELFK